MLPLLASAVAMYGPYPGFSPLFLLIPLFWLLVILLVVGLVGRRWRRTGGPGWGPAASGESVLAERFARGDIDEVEYRARLEVLRANRDAPPRG